MTSGSMSFCFPLSTTAHAIPVCASILKQSLDRQTTLALESGKPGPRHENVRGADYYDPPTTLLQ